MEINLESYRVFFVVAQTLSFSKAAKSLYISQSAVSQSIRQLEQKLGTPLFNRSTKRVTLTPDGLALLSHIEPALNMIHQGELHLQESKSLKRGQLHIAASDTICRYYLLNFFKTYHNTYPGVDIKVTNRTSVQCVELLNKGQVDFIVTNLPNTHVSEDMSITPTKDFVDVFIANPKRMDLARTYTYNDLTKHPILMLTKNTTTSEFLTQLFKEENIPLNPSIELGSIDLLVDMTRIDLGISFVPEFCVVPSEDLQIIQVEAEIPSRQIGLITHNKRPLSVASQKFIALLLAT